MNWTKMLYVLIIILIYIPMVFLGANVFFPRYTGVESNYRPEGPDCYLKYPYPEAQKISDLQREEIAQKQEQCLKDFNKNQLEWEKGKLVYEGTKYVFVALFNLIILLIVLFWPKLQDSVTMGLFLGTIGTTFGATLRYFESRSQIGFGILVLTFFAMLYFINRKRDSFVDWKEKKKK